MPGGAHGKPGLPPTRTRRYRGRDGYVAVPRELAECIIGVFGLDDRPIGGRNLLPGDTPIVNLISVASAAVAYKFPTPGAAIGGQTIGIVSAGGGVGFVQTDIDETYTAAGLSPQTVHAISIDGVTNQGDRLVTTVAAAAGGNTLTFASTGSIAVGAIGRYVSGGNTYLLLVTAKTATTLTTEAFNPATQSWVAGFQTAIPSGTGVYFGLDAETTQDLAIAGLAAPGAHLACYFLADTQKGWVDMLGRALHPNSGDFPAGVNRPSVLSSSYYISGGDDPDGLTEWGVTTALLDAVSQGFGDATVLVEGPTICIATGDLGSSCGIGSAQGNASVGDGYAHVQYPASDPWVLGVGGTTLGQYIPSGATKAAWVEFPWNAPFEGVGTQWGAGGGGISDYFDIPSYQSKANIPNSVNVSITTPKPSSVKPSAPFNATGRGVPDVAANANIRTGFSGIYFGGLPNGQIGNGTSASAPFWAGLIAVLNSNAGFNIGFANPTLYTLGPGAFNPINPLWPDPADPQLATSPTSNSDGGIPGYRTGPGWDAVTGLGSPNGLALLQAFKALSGVYILGGYQSPDIIITDLTTNQPVPIGGEPNGRWDTLLEPSTDYGFSANVHNDGPTAVNGVTVRFWAIDGGVGTNGSMVGTPQKVNIPARSTVTVKASAPFKSAPPGQHLCAVASLYSPSTGCALDALNALEIPNPGYSMTHQCSAWRNTDSMFAPIGAGFKIALGLGKLPAEFDAPIALGLGVKHVTATALNTPAAIKVANTLRALGAKSNQPHFMVSHSPSNLDPKELKPNVTGVRGIDITPGAGGGWLLSPHLGEADPQFEVSGQVPATAKKGDILLVTISANYPTAAGVTARTIEFLQFVYVTDAA